MTDVKEVLPVNDGDSDWSGFPARILFGIPIRAVTMTEVLRAVEESIRTRRPLHIGVVNAAKIVNMRRDPLLEKDVLSSDMIFADGMSVVWASRILGRPLPERVAGVDLMMEMFRLGSIRGYSVYCLGATEEVSLKVAEQIAKQFPGLRLAGRRNGYFSQDQEEGIATEIGAASADILLVAMTSPKKEKFMARWSQTMAVPVVHGVGGSFDVFAGKVERAPLLWQKLGLEWLYRVKQEPRRLWKRYLVTNVLFCGMILREITALRLGTRRGAGR